MHMRTIQPFNSRYKGDLSSVPRRKHWLGRKKRGVEKKGKERKNCRAKPSASSASFSPMPYASRASSSRSSAAATLGPLSLSSGVASPPLYVRHRPSASSYLSPPRRCSHPQGEKAIKARVHQKGRKNPHSLWRLLRPAAGLLFLSEVSSSSSTQKDSTDCRDALPPCSFSLIPFHQSG